VLALAVKVIEAKINDTSNNFLINLPLEKLMLVTSEFPHQNPNLLAAPDCLGVYQI
jgi:hypothetical protein